jgi:hypothetical protein
MAKLFSALFLFLLSFGAYADAPADAPIPATNMVGIVIFGLLFVGMCVGFFWYLWLNERKRKQTGNK